MYTEPIPRLHVHNSTHIHVYTSVWCSLDTKLQNKFPIPGSLTAPALAGGGG